MSYRLLCRLRQQGTAPILLNPLPQTSRVLAGHHLRARHLPDGLELYCEVDPHQRPILSFKNLKLYFELRSQDPSLGHRHELHELIRLLHPVFRRKGTETGLRLQAGKLPLPAGALALVELSVSSSWLQQPCELQFGLAARSLEWVYYVAASGEAAPRVVDAEGSLIFSPERLDAALIQGDPLAAALHARHPDRQLYRLCADRSLPPLFRGGLCLRLGERTVRRHLAAPNASHTTLFSRPGEKAREVFYHVLET